MQKPDIDIKPNAKVDNIMMTVVTIYFQIVNAFSKM